MALTQVSSDGIKNLNVKTADLENSGVTAGTYGSASLIPALVIDAKGRVTSASTNAITQVGGSNGVDFNDNVKARFGTSNDLSIFYDGTASFIKNTTGGLNLEDTGGYFRVKSDDIKLEAANGEDFLECDANGAVSLYYNASKKFETSSSGIKVFGDTSTGTIIQGAFSLRDTSSSSDRIKWFPNSPYTLRWSDNFKASFGSNDDLTIFHDGTDSIIKDTRDSGTLRIHADSIAFNDKDVSETMLLATADGSVNLYFNGGKKLETASYGVAISGLLDVNGGGINIDDNQKIKIGESDDLQIFHDNSANNNVISGHLNSLNLRNYDTNSTDIILSARNDILLQTAINESAVFCDANAGVHLYYSGSQKFVTTSAGVSVTGNLDLPDNTSGNASLRLGNSQDFFMNHNGTDSFIINNTGDLYIRDLNGDVHIQGKDSEESIIAKADAGVELFYNNGKRVETTSNGVSVTSSGDAHLKVTCSGHANLTLTSTGGTDHCSVNFGDSSDINAGMIQYTNSNNIMQFHTNGAERFRLDNNGHVLPSTNNTNDLGSTAKRWRNIYTGDLHLSNEGGANDIDGTYGSFTIQEGAESLFLINRRNGKKYKFNLTEVS